MGGEGIVEYVNHLFFCLGVRLRLVRAAKIQVATAQRRARAVAQKHQ